MCKEENPFTPRIRNFESSRKTRMPNNVKTYDGTGDPEDHVKVFQAAAQVERWAMPTWCHMFNSTLIGAARVWFDELPPESIDGYKDLRAAFLSYFMQQKKYVKDPVEIHNIKQRDGETIEDFRERFKIETGRMKRAHECMRISGFMHGRLPLAKKRTMYPGSHRNNPKGTPQIKGPTFENTQGREGGLTDLPPHQDAERNLGYRSKEERTCPVNFTVPLHPDFPDQEVVIEGSLSDKGRTELCSVLKKNLDIFAWLPSDMTGVPRSVAEHRLNIREGYSPVRTMEAGEYSYKGYHQIQLAEADEEYTAFLTGQGVYCYTKMPFGLKNAGATYQRLMDKAFKGQVGRNIEVYVDDLVVKSHIEAEMVRDISLRKVNMKLNPKKCSFGLAEGVFLGTTAKVEHYARRA
nr:reverse transcriptase domain-containing protein [Tanacetum cinerariifolium]